MIRDPKKPGPAFVMRVRELFNKIDSNKDGFISQEEIFATAPEHFVDALGLMAQGYGSADEEQEGEDDEEEDEGPDDGEEEQIHEDDEEQTVDSEPPSGKAGAAVHSEL